MRDQHDEVTEEQNTRSKLVLTECQPFCVQCIKVVCKKCQHSKLLIKPKSVLTNRVERFLQENLKSSNGFGNTDYFNLRICGKRLLAFLPFAGQPFTIQCSTIQPLGAEKGCAEV